MDSQWAYLPTELLQIIFSQLPIKNLGRCSQVCQHWRNVFDTDYPWRTFTFRDGMFVRRKFTQHSGWQYHIDHWRLRFLITNASRKWRSLVIRPVNNLFNLYEFFRVLTNFSEYYERNSECDKPLSLIRSFHFQWRLHVEEDDASGILQDKDIGTGGEMLHTLSNLIFHLHGLKSLTLIDLQLTHWEAEQFLQKILDSFSMQLEYLSILNVTFQPRALFHPALFLSLRKLLLSPQMLDANCLNLISCLQKLHTLIIVQDEKCHAATVTPQAAWRTFVNQNERRTQIWLILRGKPKVPLIIQPGAPVYGIKMENSSGQLKMDVAEEIGHHYSHTLRIFEQCGLERFKRGKKMNERVDNAIIHVAQSCRFLKLVACRERMSHGTALILGKLAQSNRFKLRIRENGLLNRICWSRHEVIEFGINFDEMKQICKSRDTVVEEISRLTSQVSPVLRDSEYRRM